MSELPKLNFGERKLNFLVTGGTGFIGRKLVKCLADAGQLTTVVTRNISVAKKILPQNTQIIDDINSCNDNFDIIINLAGEPISQRWSASKKQEIYNSRIKTTENIIGFIKRASKKPELLISGSAIGYYGISQDAEFNENSLPALQQDENFSQKLCSDWEASAKKAEDFGVATAFLRTGIVLASDEGALKKMLPPFKLGLGGKISSGEQMMSWVHINDEIRIIEHIINHKLSQAINATAPNPVSNEVFSRALAKALNKPCLLTIPALNLKLVFGQMAEELLLNGQKVLPEKLLNTGFKFQFTEINEAMKDIFC
jgi:uncharacterized protein (TIGR01777 family)